MTTWLYQGVTAFVIFVPLAAVLVGPFLAFVYRRYRYAAPGPALLAVAGGLYACALVAFTTFPLPDDPQRYCRLGRRIDYWQTRPLASLDDVIARYEATGLTSTLTSGVFLQVAFNVLFFVPLGVLVATALPPRRGGGGRGLATAAAAGLAVSLLIEATQGTGLWGLYPCPYRLADVDDLLTNTTGAIVGWLIGRLVARTVGRWLGPRLSLDVPRRSDLEPPTGRRRVGAAVSDLVLAVFIGAVLAVGISLVARGRGVTTESLQQPLQWVQIAVSTVVFLVVPLLRRDRATPGQAMVLLGVQRSDRPERARAWSVLVRFVVRWLPIILWPAAGVLTVAVVELVTVLVRRDDRSLTSVIAHTATRTHDAMAADSRLPSGKS
ncbi:RDD family protein [Terracoccus luteus]|uniref:RDD family protein n=1 Tax=Terracoccus luteus TaxID=53356 RepID=A0A495Y1Q8_9MICO|nr:VanZ family protein [Terracoccus luteus]RKT79569.1 RDD family protein [Terracoccus luteus]